MFSRRRLGDAKSLLTTLHYSFSAKKTCFLSAYNKYKDSVEKGFVKMCDEKKVNIDHYGEKSLSAIGDLRPSNPECTQDNSEAEESKDNKKLNENSD